MPSSRSRSRSRSPSPYSRRMALSNNHRREDRPRSRSPPRKPAHYSPSPPRRDRPRSRSPRRRHDDRPRKSNGGFKWKEKSRYGDEHERDGRLERGYREHERERPRRRSSERGNRKRRERSHDDHNDDDVEKKFGRGGGDVEDKFGRKKDDGLETVGGRDGDKHSKEPRKEKKPPPPAPTGEPLIVVNVNDRLGTKASIPCLASDPISMSHPIHPLRLPISPSPAPLPRIT